MATLHVEGSKKTYTTARRQVALAIKAARAIAARRGESVGVVNGKFAFSCKRTRTAGKGKHMRGVKCTFRKQNLP